MPFFFLLLLFFLLLAFTQVKKSIMRLVCFFALSLSLFLFIAISSFLLPHFLDLFFFCFCNESFPSKQQRVYYCYYF